MGVIGNGHVGLAVFRELQDVREVSEIVLIGRDPQKVQAEVDDYRDAAILRNYPSPRFSSGGYDKTVGCDVLVYTAGHNKLEKDRMEMLKDNCAIARDIFEKVNQYNQDAIIICITNPLDVITTVIKEVTGRDRTKVFGTGTLLDSARLTRYVADFLELSPDSVSMHVLGEHGNSSVSLLSTCRIYGKTLEEYFDEEVGGGAFHANRLSKVVQESGLKIVAKKGTTSYGVACAACKIIEAIASDARELMPVSVVLDGEYGMKGFAISTPCVIGRDGIESVKEIAMNDYEMTMFRRSAEVISNALKSIL